MKRSKLPTPQSVKEHPQRKEVPQHPFVLPKNSQSHPPRVLEPSAAALVWAQIKTR